MYVFSIQNNFDILRGKSHFLISVQVRFVLVNIEFRLVLQRASIIRNETTNFIIRANVFRLLVLVKRQNGISQAIASAVYEIAVKVTGCPPILTWDDYDLIELECAVSWMLFDLVEAWKFDSPRNLNIFNIYGFIKNIALVGAYYQITQDQQKIHFKFIKYLKY